ncbi:TIGR03766 family XrtG-associated glycosyltransferase [Companilactobacillus kimchiensis]|uniref:Integral membrane protein n=1 Tax=Companilactobacillus kimchiensis TaxID=993692 RepID=A0A0R2LJ07_9LACO|nr:TIGR03766 family XrtG-associated glycosyltransferase [Companilactobacillus kimchiensis]KRO00092.1 integral membrane protein [Companilactobacillus kimchiensis]
MKGKFFNFGNRLIRYLFYFLFLLTFYFAITSPNLILGDNSVTGAGTTMYTTVFIILSLILLVSFFTYNEFADFIKFIFIDRSLITASAIFGIAIIVQIVFVLNVHPVIGFDAGAIHEALSNTTDAELRGYYSLNPNNIPAMLVQHQLAMFFNTKSWLFFDLVTTLLVDISALLNIGSVMILARRKTPLAIYLHAVWLLLFPMIIVPYTDTWVLPLVSLYFFCYVLLRYGDFYWRVKIPTAIIFGMAVISSYFIKPSSIVGFIAIILIEFLYLFKERKDLVTEVIFGSVIILTMVPTYLIENHQIEHQDYIQVNTARSKPMINFINMGVSGDGGYNAKDSLMMAELPNRKAQIDYSKRMLKKRIGKMGPFGYIKFLFKKHRNNTADGTFAWIKEGHFIRGNTNPSSKGFRGKLRNFVYLYGKNLGDFRYVAQIWWIVFLATIVLNWRDQTKIVQTLRLAIIGGFIFLLIFEGGRSRYLIQFLPAMFILASLSIDKSWNWFKGLFSWVND